jgi:hypothetical protein
MKTHLLNFGSPARITTACRVVEHYILTILMICSISLFSSQVNASKFTCHDPKAAGKFTISLKSATDFAGPVTVSIPAGKTAAEKAALIAAKINSDAIGFTAVANGAEVTVTNNVHPGQKVFFKFGKDETGEKDDIISELDPGSYEGYYASVSPLFTISTPASGISVDGSSPGRIFIGPSSFVAEVLTVAGATPQSILNSAKVQLEAHGVQQVFVEEVSPGLWGLSFRVQPGDTFLQFGDDDTGCECSFEMFEPPTLQFHQLNFNFDGTITNNSEWGVVDVTFMGVDQIMYLNLTIDTAYAIENIPVLSTRGTGVMQTQRFWFDIKAGGLPVESVVHSLMLTPTTNTKPSYFSTSLVTPDQVTIFTGLTGGAPGGGGPGPAGKQKGGKALDPAPKMHKNFPNQESPTNYCVPTGVSNSLQWLNTKNGLGMAANDISINRLAKAFGTTTANGTVRNTIYKSKKDYCKLKKLPITTRKFSGSQIGNVAKEIKNGQDVELMVNWIGQGGKGHCVAITGITDHGNGKFSLVITHDKEQNQAGGTQDENATYDKNTKKWGGALANASGQSGDIMFLVECPVVKSKQTTNGLPGGSNHKMVGDARTTFNSGQVHLINLDLSGYSNNNPPPPPFGATFFSFTSISSFDLSLDSGQTFVHHIAPCQAFMRVNHIVDSSGVSYFRTEILQLQLQGGSLPPGFMFRESLMPADSSTGLMRMKQVPGGYQIDSFFDIFMQFTSDGGVTWSDDDNQTNVLYAHGPAVLPFLNLSNIIIDSAQSTCYDATQTITTGVDGPFIVLTGGDVTLIAGQSIHLMPETSVVQGGYLLAYITPDGQYCPDPPNIPNAPIQSAGIGQERSTVSKPSALFRAYPNPAEETIRIELTDLSNPGISLVELYNNGGQRIYATFPDGGSIYDVSLLNLKHGIYFLHVVAGSHSETFKVIRK